MQVLYLDCNSDDEDDEENDENEEAGSRKGSEESR